MTSVQTAAESEQLLHNVYKNSTIILVKHGGQYIVIYNVRITM